MNDTFMAARIGRREGPDLSRFLHEGGYSCQHCGRVSFLEAETENPGERVKCPHCRKRACVWCAPLDLSPNPQPQPKVNYA